MAVYKTLGPDDISRIPFNANKQFTFNSASSAAVGITFQTFNYPTTTLDTFSNGNDTNNSIKYQQLDHLFYKNHIRDISNRLGDADYLLQTRNLYVKTNVISIPSNLYGNKIKPEGELGDVNSKFTTLESVLKILPNNMTGQEIQEKYNIDFKLNPKSIYRPLK